MGCGCNGGNQDKNNKDTIKSKKEKVAKTKIRDDFKRFSVEKLNDTGECSNTDTLSYSTLDRLNWPGNGQNSNVNPPSNVQAVPVNVGAMSITWDVPIDYLNSPEQYLGFFVVRNPGNTAPSSYDYVTNPLMQIVYIGRGNRVGDPYGVTLTSELLNADAGLINGAVYSYSVFSISENFEYSDAAKVESVTCTAPGLRVFTELFQGASIIGDTIHTNSGNIWTITPNVGSVSDVSLGISHDPLYFFPERKNFVQLGAVMEKVDKNDKSVVITSPLIPLVQVGQVLKPNTLYSVIFYARSSYNDALLGGVTDTGANAFSGVVTVTPYNCSINQSCNLLQEEDLVDVNNPTVIHPCTANDCNRRYATYFGDGSLSWTYLGSATNGVWTTHGITFITGDNTTDSSPNNLYNAPNGGSKGTPTQEEANFSGIPYITISFTNGVISYPEPPLPPVPPWPPAGVATIAQDLGTIYIKTAISNSTNQLIAARNSTTRNIVLNPNFNFDPTILATIDGSTAGVVDNTLMTASQSWTIDQGYFGYDAIYPVTLTGAADSSLFYAVRSGAPFLGSFTLQQDMGYLTLIPNQIYTLSFDLKLNITTTSQTPIAININDSLKAPFAYFQNTPTNFPDCAQLELNAPAPYNFSLTNIGTTYTTNTVYFKVCQPVTPTVLFSIYKDLPDSVQCFFKNIVVTTLSTTANLGTNGFQTPFPIPTVPSMISKGKDPAHYIKAWDFSTPGTSGESVLHWLSRLGSAVQEPVSGRWFGGLYCLNQKDSNYTNLAIASDTIGGKSQQVLQVTANANNMIPDGKGGMANAPEGAVLMTGEYFCDGVFDVNVKLVSVKKDGIPVVPSGDNVVADPVNCCFASWVFHYIDYSGTYAPQEFYAANPIRNAEIDIELGGNCPKNDIYTVNGVQPYRFDVARLNGWGGNQAGEGGNFEMHTLMPDTAGSNPEQITLLDGKYHKLTIVLNSGYDLPIVTDANRNETRLCGYIKWYIDDLPWGCGWIGANYGFDNVPNSAMRFVVGPWFSVNWAGCLCPEQFPCVAPTDPNYDPSNNCLSCDFTLCNNLDQHDTIWDKAVFYYTYMSYKPLYENTQIVDQTNYLVPPFTVPSGFQPSEIKYPPNRAKWLPESNPYVHFDPDCTAEDVPKFPS